MSGGGKKRDVECGHFDGEAWCPMTFEFQESEDAQKISSCVVFPNGSFSGRLTRFSSAGQETDTRGPQGKEAAAALPPPHVTSSMMK